MNRWLAVWVWSAWLGVGAVWSQEVPLDPRPEIRAQREALAQAKNELEASYQQQRAACWQRFAVNDCLDRLKKQRVLDLRPLDDAEFALNDRQRAWEAQERDRRLARKQSEAR